MTVLYDQYEMEAKCKTKINRLIFDSSTKTVSIQTENKFRC